MKLVLPVKDEKWAIFIFRRMARKNVLCKKLQIIETFGAATIIASDKTGTLTKNDMTVTEVWFDRKTESVDKSGTVILKYIFTFVNINVICSEKQVVAPRKSLLSQRLSLLSQKKSVLAQQKSVVSQQKSVGSRKSMRMDSTTLQQILTVMSVCNRANRVEPVTAQKRKSSKFTRPTLERLHSKLSQMISIDIEPSPNTVRM
jgi:magnesium-transporting ATPase (P-type)